MMNKECILCANYVCELVKDKNAIIFKCGKGLDTHSLEICNEYTERKDSEQIRKVYKKLFKSMSYTPCLPYGKTYMAERIRTLYCDNREE